MKYGVIFTIIFAVIGLAYFNAQSKMNTPLHLEGLRLGMDTYELRSTFGVPSAQDRNQLTYIFEDGSELTVTLRDEVVASAKVRFHNPLKIEDPQMRELTLVQMESDEYSSRSPSWFFAGKPEEGLIYKITSEGKIESLTWVDPFSYANNRPKNLQALIRDFRTQHLSNL